MPETLILTTAPAPQSSMRETPRIGGLKAGDGYHETYPDGLTPVDRSLTLTWESLPIAEADALVVFLRAHVGVPFTFAAPHERAPRTWVAESWDRTYPYPGHQGFTMTLAERRTDAYGGIAYEPLSLLDESPSGTVVTSIGQIIVDSVGGIHSLGTGGTVLRNGIVDTTAPPNVVALVYADRTVYIQTDTP